jgi:hypothetical protein
MKLENPTIQGGVVRGLFENCINISKITMSSKLDEIV